MTPPDWSPRIWFYGHDVCLTFPPSPDHTTEHTVRIPADTAGFKAIRQLLAIHYGANLPRTLGTPVCPTQQQMEELYRAMTGAPPAKRLPPQPIPRVVAKKMTIDLTELFGGKS